MKIIQIIPQLSSGGAERFVVDLSNELSHRHKVLLIVSYALIGEISFYLPEVSENVKVESLHKKRGFDISYIYRLYKIIKRELPDVVHTHISAFGHFALLKLLFPKVKFVHTIHSDAKAEAGGIIRFNLKKMFFKKNMCRAVTISATSNMSFRNLYGGKTPATLIPNGRSVQTPMIHEDPSLIPQNEEGYNFVSIGHISQVKNHLLLCSAITELTRKGTPIELYIFGRIVDYNIYESIKALANPHIHLLGEISNPHQYLLNADVFCMSSVREGMPISLIEALSCGLIPICTAVGGIVDMVKDGKTGFLVQDMTIESYVNAIERFLSLTEVERKEMKQLCLESARQYSIEECAKKYEDLFMK